jgi:hypothetical protein
MSRLAIIFGAMLLLACGFIYLARVSRWEEVYNDLNLAIPRTTGWCFAAAHDGAGYGLMACALAAIIAAWRVPGDQQRWAIGIITVEVGLVVASLTYLLLIQPMLAPTFVH